MATTDGEMSGFMGTSPDPTADAAWAGPPSLEVNAARDRYPFCLVWTPIPCLTTLLPFVGHLGVADSRGVTYDFAGPYTISVDSLSFGRTTRYIQCFGASEAADKRLVQAWDEAVHAACQEYSGRMHNLFCDNCHSHVAYALNMIRYRGRANWNMVILAAWMFFSGRFVGNFGFEGFMKSFLPTLILYAVILFIVAL